MRVVIRSVASRVFSPVWWFQHSVRLCLTPLGLSSHFLLPERVHAGRQGRSTLPDLLRADQGMATVAEVAAESPHIDLSYEVKNPSAVRR